MDQRLFDIGLYSVADASRLTGIPASSIRRWLWGQRGSTNGRPRFLSPLWDPQPPTSDGARTLGFLDLIELRFVQALRRHGVGLPEVRALHRRAETELQCSHPFSSLRFMTEGGRLAAETGRGEVVEEGLTPLYEDLDYSETGVAVRWWPLGRECQVVIDPRRNFGHPVVHEESVSTEVLADAYVTEGSIEAVAHWYEVSDTAVRDAVAFHHRTAA